MGFTDLDKPAGLKALDSFLEERSYIEGYEPSQADAAVFDAVKTKPTDATPHALRWYNHISAFGASKSSFPGDKKAASTYGPATAAPAPAAAAEEDEDEIDLFASDDEEVDQAAEELKQKRLAEYHAKKSLKPKTIAKSMIILDVKPWDDETDMEALTTSVTSIEMDGLVWGAKKLLPIGYGIRKLQITCVVEDDKVGVDDLSDKICEFEDYVQSVDVAAFNKL